MAKVEIIVEGTNNSSNAFNSSRKDVDLLEAAVGKLRNGFAALGLSVSAWKLYDLAKDSAMLAARYDTLGVTMKVVGNNAGYTGEQMDALELKLQKTGIAMIESRQNLTSMAQAHIDLSKASELAREAQDAAVIGATNSSEAFSTMIHGIQSGQTDVLRSIGINVNFEDSYKKLGRQLGKSAEDLTEYEKTQARTNAVLEKGKDIAGSYEAAMGTAGKQISSVKRYSDNLKVTLGEVFQDALIVGVSKFTDGLKEANSESEKMQQEGKLKEWGKDLVMTFAFIADMVKGTINVIATFTGTTIAGLMQVYKLGEAAVNLAHGDLSGAKRSLQEMAAVGDAWWDDMNKRWTAKSFQDSAKDMYAQRDANAGKDKALASEKEKQRMAAAEATRKEQELRQKAEADEKRYLENMKNSISGIKEYSDAMKDLGKERLAFAGEKYSDRLKEEIDLYKEGARAAGDLIKPLQRYNAEANGVFNERLVNEKSALDKLGALYEDFKKSVSINAQSKEAKAAGVDILKAYKETATGIIAVEQDRYKTLLDGERAYANQVMSLIQAKKQEIKDLKQNIEEANQAYGEKMRGDLQGGYTTGQYRYLDPSLDAYDKRGAQIDELRRKEAEYDAIADPALKQKKLYGLISEWEKYTGQVEINGQVIIAQETAYQQVMEERKRIQDKVMGTAQDEQKKLEDLYQKTVEKMETYKQKLIELDDILKNMTRTITIDLKVNGMEAIQQIQGFVGSAAASPFASAGSSNIDFGTGWGTWADGSSADDIPQFASGTPYVQRTGMAIIHQGEAIIPASQNMSGMGNVTIGAISITLQSSGNAQTDADAVGRNIIPAIKKHLGRSLAA